ncbi:xylulokinase [Nonomuraea insulae]|uniref:FGGY-family carbohydrate kinase n=1 Tax=Nonomuraea insulae TaxID=1616787 RepID=A0ABW1D380_9ACTN
MTVAVCAVDVGTSGTRAAIVRADGVIVRSARRAHPGTAGGGFDPAERWRLLAGLLREVTDGLREPPMALGIAGHVGCVLADDAGDPVIEGASWSDARGIDLVRRAWAGGPARRAGGDDARRPDCGEGPERGPEPGLERALRVTGRPELSGGAVPLLAWLTENRPEVARKARWALSPKDHLILRLTGVAATDVTSAAYTLGFDVAAREWSVPLIEAAGVDPGLFPPAYDASEVVGAVTAEAAEATGLPAGLPVVAGGPDGTAGAAAVLGARTDVIVDVAGTTDVLNRVLTDPGGVAAGVAVLNPYVMPGLWAWGGPTGMTGGAVAYLHRLLGLGDLAQAPPELTAAMARLPPGCAGLSVVPLVSGSRFPDWRPAERGALWGLAEHHTPAHVLRATQEGAAYVVRTGLDRIDPHATMPVLLAGGAARSAELCQLRADATGRPVLAGAEPDASLLGAALFALAGAGVYADAPTAQSHLATATSRFEPDPVRADQHTGLYERWLRTRASLPA